MSTPGWYDDGSGRQRWWDGQAWGQFSDEPSPGAVLTAPASPAPSKGLGIAALIVGIVAFLSGWVPIVGVILGVIGLALGITALVKNQPKGFSVTSVILSALAVIASIAVTAGIANFVTSTNPTAVQSQSPTEDTTPSAPASETPAPTLETPTEPEVPAEYKSALTKADSYANAMYMSKAGLYDQLTSEYGEQFSAEAAQYAVDNVNADWNNNALMKAKSYQDNMAMSPEAIRDQLTSEYGEKFTPEEADYAIAHLND